MSRPIKGLFWTRETTVFCAFPTLGAGCLARLSHFGGEAILSETIAGVPLVYILVPLITLSAVRVFVAHFSPSVRNTIAWPSILLNGVLVIIFFASLHAAAGIYCTSPVCPNSSVVQINGDVIHISHDFGAALYFSIVTFTTLG